MYKHNSPKLKWAQACKAHKQTFCFISETVGGKKHFFSAFNFSEKDKTFATIKKAKIPVRKIKRGSQKSTKIEFLSRNWNEKHHLEHPINSLSPQSNIQFPISESGEVIASGEVVSLPLQHVVDAFVAEGREMKQ